MTTRALQGCQGFRRRSALALSRREMLQRGALGFGSLALAALCQEQVHAAGSALEPRPTHYTPRARRVIFIMQQGGMSGQDTFDYKPELNRRHGEATPRSQVQATTAEVKLETLMGSPFGFRQHGRSGLWISELFRATARHADDLCVVSSLHHNTNDHDQAMLVMHTGHFGNAAVGRPSFGSWFTYGLGSEARDLPGFVVINPARSPDNYRSGFLPDVYTATPLGDVGRPGGRAVPDLAIRRRPLEEQQRQLALIQARNREFAARSPEDTRLEAVIESFERGFLMQRALPEVLDFAQESRATLGLYGIDQQGNGLRLSHQLLLARRLVERGVRFVEICDESWDTHGALVTGLPAVTRGLDVPLAGLLTDLKRLGMLEDTLVIVGGEFGRTSAAETRPREPNYTPGRDHNCRGFTWILAGGGVKAGYKHGATDELGFAAVDKRCTVHDLYATFLRLLGLDHQRLTYRHAGHDFTLPDTAGQVIQDVLA